VVYAQDDYPQCAIYPDLGVGERERFSPSDRLAPGTQFYLLYWYKSANTDAEGAAVFPFALIVDTGGGSQLRGGASAEESIVGDGRESDELFMRIEWQRDSGKETLVSRSGGGGVSRGQALGGGARVSLVPRDPEMDFTQKHLRQTEMA
jgi:hypothetical protein